VMTPSVTAMTMATEKYSNSPPMPN
jgi:hypothetical protein